MIECGIAVKSDAAPFNGSFAIILKPTLLNLSAPLERRVAEKLSVCHNGLVGGRTKRLVHAYIVYHAALFPRRVLEPYRKRNI